ncbi:MAG: carboxynorspermidine decarboxylase [Methylococcaceae bacterium]
MDLNSVKHNLDSTPAYVFDRDKIVHNLTQLVELKKQAGCQVLYSIKALPLEFVLKLAKEYLDGLSVSSLFEARIAKEVLADSGTIHITTPGLRDDEFKQVAEICTHVSFNSINQYQRLNSFEIADCSLGLRVNPKLSFAVDPRFDPCRSYSKLGVDIESIDDSFENIEGLHFHTVFSNTDYLPLEKTVELLKHKLGLKLAHLKWLNLGGGYLFSQINQQQPFIKLVKQLTVDFDFEVYIEPGKTIVDDAGYLVTTVIDCFNSDGKSIAVLDTSVNHNPEVFEYQNKPELLEASAKGQYSCVLVGSSCLAGDLFGEYQFLTMPKVGDRLVFSYVGAYSLVKANRFNGYNLPDIYLVDKENHITAVKQSNYQHYREQWR